MAELLGNKFSVESLRKDVADIDDVMVNLTSRLGQTEYTSWKYPDKLAGEVNISELIEMCEYDADYDEENKISHLLLLELVIDRLIFFVQSSNRFMDQLFFEDRLQSAVDNHGSSIGVITKKYWSKMLQLYSNHQQIRSERKSRQRKIEELQSYNQQLLDDLANFHQGVTQIPLGSTQGHGVSSSSALPPAISPTVKDNIAKDSSHRSSQTVETAFVPCESCYKVQASFKAVADSMGALCKDQRLPSATAKYRKQLENLQWYSANDLARWSVEQKKDLERINKHLADLMLTINPLKEELADTIASCRALEQRVVDCQGDIKLEKENQRTQEKQHSSKVQSLINNHNAIKDEMEAQCVQLRRSEQLLQDRLKETQSDLQLQTSRYKELEAVKKQLMVEMEEMRVEGGQVEKLQSALTSLEQEIMNVTAELNQTRQQLQQEQTITKSLTKRTESLQTKYDSLVRRIDEMDDESNALQSELSALAEEKEQLENSLQESISHAPVQSLVENIQEEKTELKKHMASLQSTISSLEEDVRAMKEREKLLVEYPDLNGAINTDMQASGDLATDMANQVAANQVRISLLQKQTTSMEKTLEKLRNKSGGQKHSLEKRSEERNEPRHNSVPATVPTALWRNPESEHLISNDRDRRTRPTSEQTQTSENVSSKYSERAKKDRPPQGRSQESAGVDAYIKLRKAGLLKGTDNESRKKGAMSSDESGNFCCRDCGKLYHTLSDLDIHKSYCAHK